jgi:hypothetical protein
MQGVANCIRLRFTKGAHAQYAVAKCWWADAITIAIAAAAAVLAASSSHAEDNKACVLKATKTLPSISGLVIKKTRTRPVPPAILATWQGQTRPIIVDLDIVAAGASETYSYICVLTKGSAYVRRVTS